jgi:hypothetical protein
MDYELVKIGLSVFNLLLTCGVGLFAWSDRKDRATMESIKELERVVAKKLDEKAQRISKLEMDLREVPSRNELVRIHERLDEMASSINTRLEAMNDSSSKGRQETALLLGKLLGAVEQMNGGKNS